MRSLAKDIRAGLKLRPDSRKAIGTVDDGNGNYCVMGLANIAATGNQSVSFKKNWPEQCAVVGLELIVKVYGYGLIDHAVNLNNETDMTREQIADAVELLEWKYLGILPEALERELSIEAKEEAHETVGSH